MRVRTHVSLSRAAGSSLIVAAAFLLAAHGAGAATKYIPPFPPEPVPAANLMLTLSVDGKNVIDGDSLVVPQGVAVPVVIHARAMPGSSADWSPDNSLGSQEGSLTDADKFYLDFYEGDLFYGATFVSGEQMNKDGPVLQSSSTVTFPGPGTYSAVLYDSGVVRVGSGSSGGSLQDDRANIESWSGNPSSLKEAIGFVTFTVSADQCANGGCVSNVMFLPGIEGSRLYEGTGCGKPAEEKLWDPVGSSSVGNAFDALRGAGDARVAELALDTNGKSVCSDIYTKTDDVIDAVGGGNIYRSFIDEMNGLKSDGTIKDWEPVAYDWRLSLDDLLAKGAERDGKIYYEDATSTPYIEQTLRRLAASSKTGKVTIVAHSNGGLVAKALLAKLGDAEAAKLVDRVIMVAVPQAGAPSDVASMLVGYGAGIYKYGFPIVSDAAARAFASTSPMAYHLLPSADYLASIINEPTHPVVHFSGDAYATERSLYGNSIIDAPTLDAFLEAAHGERQEPAASNLMEAAVLSPSLVGYANSVHNALDAWAPPAGIKVDQIAGWGVDTVAGVDFYTGPKTDAATALAPVRSYRPIIIEDGDGTVTTPSALLTPSSENVKRYWVDLHTYNKDTSSSRNHADLFEVSPLQDFVRNLITNSTSTLPTYVSAAQPATVKEEKKLIFFLHSPLTLQLTDAAGNVTGLAANGAMTQDIPGSSYSEFGEVKYITVPEGRAYQLTMHGQASGTFTLDAQEMTGEAVTASSTIAGVPTTASTTVAMSIGPDLSALSPMTIDKNGDGTVDATVVPKLDGTVVFDTTPPEIRVTFSTSTQALAFIGTDDSGSPTLTVSTVYPTHEKSKKQNGKENRNENEEENKRRGVSTTTVTASDAAGNTATLVYTEQFPSHNQEETIALRAFAYNGATTTLSGVSADYEWEKNRKKGVVAFLAELVANGVSLDSRYKPEKNETTITRRAIARDDRSGRLDDDERDARSGSVTRETMPGMVVPYLETEKGSLIINY